MTDQRDILDRLREVSVWLKAEAGSTVETAVTAAISEITAHRAEIERLRKQLPEEMQDCTIQFRECANGHGWLTATNWLEHDCQQCEIERLKLGLYAARNSYPVRLPGDPPADPPQPERWEIFSTVANAVPRTIGNGWKPFAVADGLVWFRRRVTP